MSRLGKQKIVIPEKTEVKKDGAFIIVKGPLGETKREFRDEIEITIGEKEITLSPKRNDLLSRALWGTYASHLKNMIRGVHALYEKKLILEGVGFKSEVKPARPDNPGHSGGGKELLLALGFSHPVKLAIPEELNVKAEKNVITITGINKELVGQFTGFVRAKKKPEPYKGKGFRYHDEVIRRKQGKKAA